MLMPMDRLVSTFVCVGSSVCRFADLDDVNLQGLRSLARIILVRREEGERLASIDTSLYLCS